MFIYNHQMHVSLLPWFILLCMCFWLWVFPTPLINGFGYSLHPHAQSDQLTCDLQFGSSHCLAKLYICYIYNKEIYFTGKCDQITFPILCIIVLLYIETIHDIFDVIAMLLEELIRSFHAWSALSLYRYKSMHV